MIHVRYSSETGEWVSVNFFPGKPSLKPANAIISLVLFLTISIGGHLSLLWAAPPNVVLSQAIHFSAPNGEPVTLSPGKYLIEMAGPTELLVTSERDQHEFIIQAESLTHNQYELFSPMALTRPRKHAEFLIELYLPGGVRLEAKGSSKQIQLVRPPTSPSTPPTSVESVTKQPIESLIPSPVIPEPETPAVPSDRKLEKLASVPSPQLLGQGTTNSISYRPQSPDHPGLRIDAINDETDKLPTFFVLAPNHVGLTSQEQPALFWYLSKTTNDPLDVMISEEGNLRVLLDVRLLAPLQAGIHQLRLEDYGIGLIPDVSYQWTVRIMSSQSSGNLTASGVIQRIASSSSLSSSSLSNPPQSYAQDGLWYDAFSALSGLIQGNPGNSELVAQRISLLEQVGLSEVATFVKHSTSP